MSDLTTLVLQAPVMFYTYTQEWWEDLKSALKPIEKGYLPE